MTHHRIACLLAVGGIVAGSLAVTACGDKSATPEQPAAPTSGAAPGYDTGTPPAPTTAAADAASTAVAAAASSAAVVQGNLDNARPPGTETSTSVGSSTAGSPAAAASTGATPSAAPTATATLAAASAADTASQAAASPPPAASKAAGGGAGAGASTLYKVVDGDKVDPETLKGFRTWRAAACDRCHGANQEGMVGPSLIASLKTLTKEQFVTTVSEGRLAKGMPAFKTSTQVMENMDQLYAYLKGRSDGAITSAKVQAIE